MVFHALGIAATLSAIVIVWSGDSLVMPFAGGGSDTDQPQVSHNDDVPHPYSQITVNDFFGLVASHHR